MIMDKRTFIKNISLLGVGMPVMGHLDKWISKYEKMDPEQLAGDEIFWEGIRKGFRLKPDYINVENEYESYLPQETLENFIQHVREVNYQGSYYVRTVQWDNKKVMVAKLASIGGCSAEELIITRNTTESLDMIIGGIDWKQGDEAIMAEQDYGSMLDMFKQVAKRFGVVN